MPQLAPACRDAATLARRVTTVSLANRLPHTRESLLAGVRPVIPSALRGEQPSDTTG